MIKSSLCRYSLVRLKAQTESSFHANLRTVKLNLLFLFCLLLLQGSFAFAGTRLCVWQPDDGAIRLLIPALDGQSCSDAVQKYVDAVNGNSELRSGMLGSDTLKILPQSKFYDYAKSSDRPQFIALANEFDQMQSNGFVISVVLDRFGYAGADIYVLPVAADLGLPAFSDGMDFRGEINSTFDAMLALGGADIDPALYREPIMGVHASEIRTLRDQEEMEYHKAYIDGGKGVFYGICRGHQLASISQGECLYEDIYQETPTSTEHRNGAWHQIQIGPDSLMSEIAGGKTELWVNSFHHEAVKIPATGDALTVTAFEKDNPNAGNDHIIVEAMEGPNRRYLTMQFHPEAMDNDDGVMIRKNMVDYAARYCNRVLGNH
jgi:putative glutamine amidotransferase